MTYDEMIRRVSQSTGLPILLVDRTYKSYWKMVREHISTLPLKEELTDDEFQALQPNVNIPSIGKLYVTLERYKSIKRRYKQKQDNENVENKESKTDVHQHTDNR